MTDRTIEYGNRSISYSLDRSERKRIRVIVTPEMQVKVLAPLESSEFDIQERLYQKAKWIAKQLNYFLRFQPLPKPQQFISGETFKYLGRQYRLKVEAGNNDSTKLVGKYIIVVTKNRAKAQIESMLESWYREHAKKVFERYLRDCLSIATRHSIEEPPWVIRKMKTRWGSCSARGRITLNLFLIQAPVHCIEYVIMHELCHLKHPNHSQKFYSLLSRFLPDWKRRRQDLETVHIHF